MEIIYDVKKGLSIKGDVQKLGEELFNIKNKTPDKIITYAKKNKKSILYKNFTWNDSIAGDKYRIYQARHIINHILIRRIDEEEVSIRAFESIPIEEEEIDEKRIYVNTIEAITNEVQRQKIINEIKILLAQAMNKLDAFNSLISLLLNKGII